MTSMNIDTIEGNGEQLKHTVTYQHQEHFINCNLWH